MVKRCTNPNYDRYPFYGGRGIKVHEPWMKFENFLADMGKRPEGTTLGRIAPNANYEPGSCEWQTRKEQARIKRNNRWITWQGNRMTAKEFADLCGVVPSAIYNAFVTGKSRSQIVRYYSRKYLKRKENLCRGGPS